MPGISLTLGKIEGSFQCLTFLGINLDTQLMQACLPEDKLKQICNQLVAWLSRKKATKRNSVLGRPSAAHHQSGNTRNDFCF